MRVLSLRMMSRQDPVMTRQWLVGSKSSSLSSMTAGSMLTISKKDWYSDLNPVQTPIHLAVSSLSPVNIHTFVSLALCILDVNYC